MKKIIERSNRDDVIISIVAPDWVDKLDDRELVNFRKVINGFCNYLSGVVTNKESFWLMAVSFNKYLVNVMSQLIKLRMDLLRERLEKIVKKEDKKE